jgi:hypothetical protein
MTEQKFLTPLKIGILIVVISYFLFTLHATFTLEWWGEWDRIAGGSYRSLILIEDIAAFIGIVFRFAASIIAFAAVLYYLVKKSISKPTVYKILKVSLVFEGIYWLGLSATTFYTVEGFVRFLGVQPLLATLDSLALGVIPSVIEGIVVPIALFILAFKLNLNKPLKGAIKWTLITGLLYIVTFWLVYTSIWEGVIRQAISQNGLDSFLARPENIINFALTAVGLAALAIYTAYFTKKSSGAQTLQELKLKGVGGIILALGMYFLWNYISWALLAGATWNSWYMMFLGHNLDLWMLSLPLLGLPLLFTNKPEEKQAPPS